jgi:hypothetical protein
MRCNAINFKKCQKIPKMPKNATNAKKNAINAKKKCKNLTTKCT